MNYQLFGSATKFLNYLEDSFIPTGNFRYNITKILHIKYYVRYNNIMLRFLLRCFKNILFVKEFTLHVNARELFVMLEINLGLSSETSRENFT